MARSEMQSLGQLAAQVVAKGDPSCPGPVATLGQGDGPQAQSPRRGRKGNASQDGKPVQLALFDGLGPVMPSALHRHPLYAVWANMKKRCGNPKSPQFMDYGGRGIVVCEEWCVSSRAFVAWALANGWKPGLQLDRCDNDGPYSPGNCRFVTRKVNQRNRRDTIRGPDGSTLADHAERLGMSRSALMARLARGIPWAEAVAMPPQRRQNGGGRAQPASDGGRGRESRRAVVAAVPGRCPRGDERNGHA